MPIVKVALPIPRRQLFEYECNHTVTPGYRVKVPFGPRTMIGVVVACGDSAEWDAKRIKPVIAVLDTSAVVDTGMLALCQWLAGYYMHPIGDVIQAALPVALRKGLPAQPEPIEMLRLTDTGKQTDLADLKRAPRQQALMALLLQGDKSRAEVRASFASAVIKGVEQKGLLEAYHQLPQPRRDWQKGLVIGDKPTANVEQAAAIAAITAKAESFSTFLIEGVTGSGKTEVYLQSIEPVLQAGRQVLILVPEIGLTPQTVLRFRQRFNLSVGVLHSNLTDNERLAVWYQSQQGELPIIIGTRSAVFTPMLRPGMIIVDEEHDGSYKQKDGLRYHARDFAVKRAHQLGIPLLLGSATPSLETLNNALAGRYHHLLLQQRAGNALHTRQQVLDIRDQQLQYGIASGMINAIRQHLQQGNQVLLFINRRGFAPAVICHHCGHVENCQRCDRPFTMHKQLNKIQCHHCGAARPLPKSCGACGSHELAAEGVGTEQLEMGLTKLFPDYASIRIDSDTTRSKSRLNEMLDKVNSNEYQILIGTQILSKGHHFPNVTLVVILDVDGALFSADFRAAENLAQLVTQLAGRAGRADKPGEMWLQSHNPGHPLLQDLLHNGYSHFARYALMERQHAGLPPHCYQALFRAEAIDGRQAHQFLADCASLFSQAHHLLVLGPVPAIMEKRQGRFRMQLLLQAAQRATLHQALHRHLPAVESSPLAAKVRWSVDVDPQDFS